VRSTRRKDPSNARGWLTLFVLIVIVGVLSVGPGTIIEAVRGLTFVRPPAATVPAPPPHTDVELEKRLTTATAGLSSGSIAATIVDLRSGATAAINAEEPYPAASLFKLPILAEVLAEESVGMLSQDQLLEVRPDDWTDGSGVLQARVGDRVPVRELLRLMIQDSDNIAALMLLDAVGIDHVNSTAQRLGLTETHIVDHRAGEDGDHTTSANDMALLLRTIATGQLVNAQVSESALQLLELKQANAWLTDDLPFWVKLAHKWGDLPDARNDAGIVFAPRGSSIVVVLTRDGDPDEAAQTIARTARAAYDFVGAS
jgi:beta-lactamase class A